MVADDFVEQYLEFIVKFQSNVPAQYHNQLGEMYLRKVLDLQMPSGKVNGNSDNKSNNNKKKVRCKPGEEPGLLGVVIFNFVCVCVCAHMCIWYTGFVSHNAHLSLSHTRTYAQHQHQHTTNTTCICCCLHFILCNYLLT